MNGKVSPPKTNPLDGARWITDPGHGWLAVPADVALRVPGISSYSYLSPDGRTAYLECDEDAGRFAAHFGVELSAVPVTSYDDDAPCRRMRPYLINREVAS
jgi:hypothetical protein